MIVTAKFVGQSSLGYLHGKDYKLEINGFSIRRLDGSGFCMYTSLKTFLKNWDEIKQLKK